MSTVVFSDTFTGSDTTALTSHAPDVGSSWSLAAASTSPILSNANRARTSGTGASDKVWANPVSALSTHDHDVATDLHWFGAGGAGGGKVRLYSHDGNYAIEWTLDVGTLVITPSVTNPSLVATTGEDYRLAISTRTSGSDVAVDFYLQRLSDNFYLKSDGTFQSGAISFVSGGTLTDTSPPAVGKGGLSFYEYAGNAAGVHADNFTITDFSGGGALAAGVATAVSSASGVALYLDGTNGSTAPSGGTPTYAYQWHRSPTPGFTPSGTGGSGTSIAGATANTYSDTSGTESVAWCYKCVIVDSAGSPATATTAQVEGLKNRADLSVGFVGDSLYYNTPSGGSSPPDNFAGLLRYRSGHSYGVTATNRAASGSATADWLPSASVWVAGSPSTGGLNLMDFAVAGFVAAGTTDVLLRLGANDGGASVSAATYGSNLATICSHLLANVPTLARIYLNYPTYARDAGSYGGANATYQGYQAQIDALVNGTTIRAGDKRLWDYSSASGTAFRSGDDIHPNAAGSLLIAQQDVDTLLGILYPSAGGISISTVNVMPRFNRVSMVPSS